jgi:hypothetical protein
MQKHRLATLSALMVSLSGSIAISEEEFHQEGAHEHGHVTLNVALQGDLLAIELDAPVANVLGFERAPRDAAEIRFSASQDTWLRSGRDAIGVPRAARCQLEKSAVSSPDWARSGGDHRDYRASWRFRCTAPAALAWFEPWLLAKLLAVTDVDVNIVSGALQTRVEASGPRQRIALR